VRRGGGPIRYTGMTEGEERESLLGTHTGRTEGEERGKAY